MREFVGENGKGVRQENVRSSEDYHYLTTTCQIEDANVVLQGRTVRVQTVYHNKDVVTVRHNRGREISPF